VTESLDQLRARLRAALRARFDQVALAFNRAANAPHHPELRQQALTELHTLKGEARLLGLTAFATLAHDLETNASEGGDPATFAGALGAMGALLNDSPSVEGPAVAARSQQSALQETLFQLARHAQARAERAGKPLNIEVSAPLIELSFAQLDCLRPALLHLLENALDHGVESPQERGKKPALGRLALRAELADAHLRVVCEDDGRGIDLDQVRVVAVRRGLLGAETAARASPAQLYDLLFEHGFSTASQVTPTSGRGVGLDGVRRNVRALGGEVSLESTLGLGTRFVISVPLRSAER
jgi:two-component system, chemotaxis family, sensor kinase CheA